MFLFLQSHFYSKDERGMEYIMANFFLFFFLIMFVYFERDRERESTYELGKGREAERRERMSGNAGLDPTTVRS